MGSLFEEVYPYALKVIEDYKIDKLAKTDYESFLLYLEGILINAISEFDGCLTSLDYEYIEQEDDNGIIKKVPCFKEKLTAKEKSILGKLMVIVWFTGKIQDVTQFQGSLNTREFRKISEANNLKQKGIYLNSLIEGCEQDITNYQIQNLTKLPYFGDF